MMKKWTKKRPIALSDFSDEVKLLLLLSRYKLSLDELCTVQTLSEKKIDWQRFTRLAIEKLLAALVYSNETKWEINVLPAEVREKFKQLKLKIFSFNTLLYHDYKALQKACNDESLACVPIKGVYLAEKIYGDIGLRQISDIDVIIEKKDQDKVMKVLHQLNWKVRMARYKSRIHQKCKEHHTPFMAINGRNVIDFHFDMFNKGKNDTMPYSRISENLKPDILCDLPISQLEPHDLVIYLALHLHAHLIDGQNVKISSFVDISLYIRSKIDLIQPETLLDRSKSYAVLEKVNLVLALVNTLCPPIPSPFQIFNLNAFDSKANAVLLNTFGEIKFGFFDKLKGTLSSRFKIRFYGWKTLPLIWFDIFPSKLYLEQTQHGKGYLKNWFRRITRLKSRV